MNCRDAERLWNERLDARDEPRPGLDAALEGHAASCPSCALVAARYRALRQAIAALPWPEAPAGLVARVLADAHVETDRRILSIRRVPRRAWLAAAASIAAVVVGLWAIPTGPERPAVVGPRPAPEADLADALADATSATLELARDASAPAGRFGRAVLASARLPGADAPSPAVPAVSTPDVLRSVGDRVGAGVRPLSGSAQSAFGFLWPDATGPSRGPSPTPPPRSGA